MKELNSEHTLGEIIPNIATLLNRNVAKFHDKYVYQEKNKEGVYEGIKWEYFYHNIEKIAYNLKQAGFQKGEKMILFTRNRLEMLELELAIMAYGGIAVPIFAHFKQDTAELLINHSEATWMAVAGQEQMNNLGGGLKQLKSIFHFDEVSDSRYSNLVPFSALLKEIPSGEKSCFDDTINGGDICLNMYTSGTMGTPKCVQLTHKNILSQQAALDVVWDVTEQDRFLAYLPWHHSFGGIFELFTALYNGATFYLESSYGRDVDSIFENWKLVRPTIFFSVPKVYQSLYEKTLASKEAEDIFFNSGLKFIFTAAAALPEKLSQEFQKRNIPVIEGWGLTETSPCCTLTDPTLKRVSGVVGKPIPGVSVRIADDEEIQVKGPNIMIEYYHNDEANEGAFTEDGWYRTGDVGELTETGLKLISRKDRIFKLSNGEKVVPTDLEKVIELKCHYVQHVIISGSGEDHPVALIFPNKKMLEKPDYQLSPEDGCFCPRNLNELGKCLQGCLHDANGDIKQKFSKIKSAAIINTELSLDDNTLTPSMKVAPKNVLTKYKNHLINMYGENVPTEEEVYVVHLDTKNDIARKIIHD
ncbi:MAG: AMP-binding protein [Flavobacteriales bacterium]|nr:AMP-binding protein [Flavobacteriales bacterium]